MKDFEVRFYAYHRRLRSREATMKMRGRSLKAILPRIKKVEEALNKLPNPHEHNKWIMTQIEEIEKTSK